MSVRFGRCARTGRVAGAAIVMTAAISFAVAACHGGDTSVTGVPSNSPIDPLASLASCGTKTLFFTTPPLELSAIAGWVPLGNMAPPGHIFPTDHQYIYLTSFLSGNLSATIPLLSPGDVTIISAKSTKYSGGTVPQDYAITYAPCAQVSGEFGHVRSIEPGLLAQIGPFDQDCSTYVPSPGLPVTQCYSKNVKVAVKAGAVIGTAAGLDLGLYDARIAPLIYANPARWQANPNGIDHFHVVPITDYFAEPARSAITALLGSFDGKAKRTAAPIGGSIESDILGTLQGAWFNPAQPTYPEYLHMAITPFNVDPSSIHLSMGTSQSGFLSSEYSFTPTSSGNVNRHPAQVTPGAQMWCYDLGFQFGIVLMQLSDATTLKFEGRNGQTRTCASEQPWAFTAAAFTFKR